MTVMPLLDVRRVATMAGLAGLVAAGGLRLAADAGHASGGRSVPAAPHRDLVNDYCLDCHDNSAKKAGLSLEAIVAGDVAAHADVWEKVVKKLGTRQMPPLGEPRPDEATYAAAISSLGASLDRAAAAHPNHQVAAQCRFASGVGRRASRTRHENTAAAARVPSGMTPLLFAVREGRLDAVHVLLKAGADVNEAIPVDGARRRGYGGGLPPAGATPLLLAVKNAHFELAAALLDAGANPNADGPGYTVLHAITVVRKPGLGDNDPAPEGSGTMSSLDLVKKLVAHGANVDARMTKKPNLNNTRLNELGATPFLLAALTADAELMKVLAALGADPSLTNDDDSTPLMVAAGLATRSPGEDAGTEGEVIQALQVALDLGADLNAVDKNGETAMHGAAYKNLPKAVTFLAAKGARIDVWNRPDRFEWTPLAIAAGYRFGNFKPSPETEAAIRAAMVAAGVTPPAVVVAKTQQVY